MPLVRMKAAPVKTDGERLGNEFMNGVFFSAHMSFSMRRANALKSRALSIFKVKSACHSEESSPGRGMAKCRTAAGGGVGIAFNPNIL